jgi:outer membrane protein assembly factor BamB
MKKVMTMLLLTCCALTGSAFAKDLLDPMQSKMDKKNVVTSIGDLVILRSHEEYASNLNSAISYLEAYNKYTGQRVWAVRDVGAIMTYDVVDPYTIVYRNYGRLTAVDIRTGVVLWYANTLGTVSVIPGE